VDPIIDDSPTDGWRLDNIAKTKMEI